MTGPPPIGDPSVAADFSKGFGHAFQFQPLTGVHLVSAGMHGVGNFYMGALHVGQAVVILGKFDPEKTLAAIERHYAAAPHGADPVRPFPPSAAGDRD